MVVAVEMKPSLKVSVSDNDSSSAEESEDSENEMVIDDDVEADDDIEADDDVEAEDDVEADDAVESDDAVEADAESVASDDEKPEVLVANEGWADSVAKILGSNKPKNKKTLVLSRAKKYSEIVKKVKEEKPSFEIIGEIKAETTEVMKEDSTEPPSKKVKHEKPSIRTKPNILEKDRERLLAKIATKGVVQLFNAVRNQQKTFENEMGRKDLSEGKKEKLLKKFDKRAFLDSLMGQSKSVVVDQQIKSTKEEVKEEDKPTWSALRDDFMTGAKMKDWDKESVDE